MTPLRSSSEKFNGIRLFRNIRITSVLKNVQIVKEDKEKNERKSQERFNG